MQSDNSNWGFLFLWGLRLSSRDVIQTSENNLLYWRGRRKERKRWHCWNEKAFNVKRRSLFMCVCVSVCVPHISLQQFIWSTLNSTASNKTALWNCRSFWEFLLMLDLRSQWSLGMVIAIKLYNENVIVYFFLCFCWFVCLQHPLLDHFYQVTARDI